MAKFENRKGIRNKGKRGGKKDNRKIKNEIGMKICRLFQFLHSYNQCRNIFYFNI